LADHRGRDRRPGDALYAVRCAVPTAEYGRTTAAATPAPPAAAADRGEHVDGDRAERRRAAGRVRAAERRVRSRQPVVRSHTERGRGRSRRWRWRWRWWRRGMATAAAARAKGVAQHAAVRRGKRQHVRQRQTVEVHAQSTGADRRLVRL